MIALGCIIVGATLIADIASAELATIIEKDAIETFKLL